MLRLLLSTIILLVAIENVWAIQPYSLEVKILSRLNEKNPDDYDPLQKLHATPHRIAILYGWVKLQTLRTEGISPEKIYLEWVFVDAEGKDNILESGLMIGNKHLEFTWNPDKPTTYYWVTKRIWTDQIGGYKLRLINKKRQYLGETEITVGD